MAIAAQLYQDDRIAERYRVELDATLRDSSHAPVDVVVEDLSATGFRMTTNATLHLGDEIGLGLAGIGAHRARVVWSSNDSFGCEFLTFLSHDDVKKALAAPSTEPVRLAPPTPWELSIIESGREPATRRLPIGTRIIVIFASAVAAWGLAIALGVSVARFF